MIKADGSAVSAVGGEVRPKLGRKSKLRHSPLITEAQPLSKLCHNIDTPFSYYFHNVKIYLLKEFKFRNNYFSKFSDAYSCPRFYWQISG